MWVDLKPRPHKVNLVTSSSTPNLNFPSQFISEIAMVSKRRETVDTSCTVDRNLVVSFCDQPHHYNRPYYLTSSSVVAERPRDASCLSVKEGHSE